MIDTADYRFDDVDAAKNLVRQHGWARLISTTTNGIIASHVPILLVEGTDDFIIESHLGRPDEQLHELGTAESLLIVEGPNGYISPGWYDRMPAVPTWNYVAAHIYGTPELMTPDETMAVLERTVTHFERVRDEPFEMNSVQEYASRIASGTAGFRFVPTRWRGKAKLSQDKPRSTVDRILSALEHDPQYGNIALRSAMLSVLEEKL